MTKINPFKPHSPVPTGMFAGRYEEIISLEKGLFQTKNGYNSNFLITGERGIGKSSLLIYLKHISSGNVPSIKHGTFDFVTINIVISSKIDLITLIKLIEQKITREVGKLEFVRNFLKEIWSFVQRIKVMDSGIEQTNKIVEADLLMDNFAHSLSETCNRIIQPEKKEDAKDGILFLIDEADNACPDLRIGYFFKTVTELLQQNDCNNVVFVVAGLPDIVEKLSCSHKSSVRIFTQLEIKELSLIDREYVIDKGIEKGNTINSEQTTITKLAKQSISSLSEGYPHFIQQFAFSAFEVNTNGEISDEDVFNGAFNRNGALDVIGRRYYESDFYDKIKSDDYRQVLSIMAGNLNAWIKKGEIRKKFTGDDQTLTNALQALTTRKIILKNPSKMGEYRLQQKGFAHWITLFGNRKK